jgi:hypothetical protein
VQGQDQQAPHHGPSAKHDQRIHCLVNSRLERRDLRYAWLGDCKVPGMEDFRDFYRADELCFLTDTDVPPTAAELGSFLRPSPSSFAVARPPPPHLLGSDKMEIGVKNTERTSVEVFR